MSINVAQNNGTVAIKQLFKFQKNCKLTRTLALEAVDQGNAENLKKGFYYLLNKKKANTSTNWLNVERDSSNDLVELLHDAIKDGYTVRLGIKPVNSNTDRDVKEVYGCFLDVDETSTIQTFSNYFSQYACIFYHTPSYIKGTNEKHRLVFIFDRGVNNLEARIIIRWLYKVQYKSSNPNERFSDVSCLDPARLFFPAVTSNDVSIRDLEARLPVDIVLEEAKQSLSKRDLSDCYERSGVILNGNGNGKTIINPGKLLDDVEEESDYSDEETDYSDDEEDTPESTEKTKKKITDDIEKYIFDEIFVKSGYDPNSIFCGIDHQFKEVRPDAGDRRQNVIRVWLGLNPWTSNKSGESFKLSLKDDDRFMYIARGSGNGEDGGDAKGGITNYWCNIFKGKWQGRKPLFEPDDLPNGEVFEKTIKTFLKYKGEKIPQFFIDYCKDIKGETKKKTRKAKTFADLLDEFEKEMDGRLRFNEMDSRCYYDDSMINLNRPRASASRCFRRYSNIPSHTLLELIEEVAHSNRFHPFRDYLKENYKKHENNLDMGLIENLSTRYFKTDNYIYDVYLKKTLIGAVARVMNESVDEGVEMGTVCVIQGWQGCGKTSFWRTLAGGKKYFHEGFNLGNKERDDYMKLNRSVLIEFGELESIFKKKDIADLRNFITTQIDRYRSPYERYDDAVVRRSIFVGTVNPKDVLNDSEGHRRFWVIPANLDEDKRELVDNVKLAQERDMLWAVATKLFLDGHIWHLTNEEEKARIESNEEFTYRDSIEEIIMPVANNYQSFTISQFLLKHFANDYRLTDKSFQMRIANILKINHWKQERKKYKNVVYRVWYNPDKDCKGLTFREILERDEAISQAMSNAF